MMVRNQFLSPFHWGLGGLQKLTVADATTWSPTINELVQKGTVDLTRFDLTLEYDYWNYGKMRLARCGVDRLYGADVVCSRYYCFHSAGGSTG